MILIKDHIREEIDGYGWRVRAIQEVSYKDDNDTACIRRCMRIDVSHRILCLAIFFCGRACRAWTPHNDDELLEKQEPFLVKS